MQEYAEKERLITQPRPILVCSFERTNDAIMTSMLLFYLERGLLCTKGYRFVKYAPLKCPKNFVQSAVNARRQRHENPNSRCVAENMELLVNISCGYQIMDRCRHSVTSYMTDAKICASINNRMLKN